MSAVEYPLEMSREAFEAWASTVAERWEWVRGFAIPVPRFAGGTWAHARIASRVFSRLSVGLQPPCEAIIGDLMRVATPTSQRYGDIYVVCEPVDPAATVLRRPKVVIEIVSHDSVERDLLEKRDEYLDIAGLEAYFAFFEEEHRVLEYLPHRRHAPTEHRDAVSIHAVTIALADPFDGPNPL
ncbi:MAG: Uma2 family endonuclease [Candidatus Eremiobacteraeota bacterium]|nr:Uma2 family endonuclease [Candidatus Eremiobacteraeota bacterium]MBC5802197.1 Uma2 family endonuclease [Candidatus Eremiobacteraeota bacterium]MBC5822745.1 Uma2 family endonuclease [Candidatus Eremiobacteraeota bacterium]